MLLCGTCHVGRRQGGEPGGAKDLATENQAFTLLKDSFIFDPSTEPFTRDNNSIDGHLCPTLTKLGNDDVYATCGPGLPDWDLRDQGASVLLPPAQDQRGIVAGGGYGPHDRLLRAQTQVDRPGQPAPAPLPDPAGDHGPPGAAFRGEAPVIGGKSTVSFRQGLYFVRQFAGLRFSLMSRFAAVGAFGTVLNLAIMAVLLGLGAHYMLAAIVATELTILSNFLMQERLVFRDMRGCRPFWQRILASFGFNNIETLVRMPVLVLLVDLLLIPGLVAQAATLAVAFLIRFAFTSRVIYRIHRVASRPVLVASFQEEQLS